MAGRVGPLGRRMRTAAAARRHGLQAEARGHLDRVQVVPWAGSDRTTVAAPAAVAEAVPHDVDPRAPGAEVRTATRHRGADAGAVAAVAVHGRTAAAAAAEAGGRPSRPYAAEAAAAAAAVVAERDPSPVGAAPAVASHARAASAGVPKTTEEALDAPSASPVTVREAAVP